jgi:NAD(P)-dependent dehydrogenase (short-subunit alcohol dehydrogenase family)
MAHNSHDVPNPMAPLHELEGKVAYITGGSSGIGRGIARACSEAGMKVIITYRTPAHLEETRSYFEGKHAGFHAIRLDVTDRDAMVRAADEVEEVFGNIHLMVNNAGVGVATPMIQGTFNDWDFSMGVNVGGIINGIQIFVPRIIAHGEPAQIVSTSSMSGLFIGATAGIYTTTKYAVVGMMEALRAELEPHGIGASVFCPGVVRSNIGQSNRNRPEELQNPETMREDQNAAREARRMQQQADMTPEQLAEMRERFSNAAMDPLECGRKVLRGVRRNDMFIITHPEYGQGIEDRCEALVRSIPVGDAPPPPARLMVEERVLTARIYIDEIKKLKGYGY